MNKQAAEEYEYVLIHTLTWYVRQCMYMCLIALVLLQHHFFFPGSWRDQSREAVTAVPVDSLQFGLLLLSSTYVRIIPTRVYTAVARTKYTIPYRGIWHLVSVLGLSAETAAKK